MAIKVYQSLYGTAVYGTDRYGEMFINDDPNLNTFHKSKIQTLFNKKLILDFYKKLSFEFAKQGSFRFYKSMKTLFIRNKRG